VRALRVTNYAVRNYNAMSFILGILAGTLCALSFLPQVIRIYKTKHTKDLSLTTFSVFAAGVSVWLIYGVVIGEPPVVIANSVILVFIAAILIMKVKYG
jgi:MtN3 and saliva related transmembrane protein